MTRPRNWDGALVAWALTQRGQPFAWGVTDCHTLARQALALVTGVACPLRVEYATAFGAARAWVEHGGWPAYVAAWGLTPIAPAFATGGDLLVWTPPEGRVPHLAVLVDTAALTASPEAGVELAPHGGVRSDVTVWRATAGAAA